MENQDSSDTHDSNGEWLGLVILAMVFFFVAAFVFVPWLGWKWGLLLDFLVAMLIFLTGPLGWVGKIKASISRFF